MAVNLDLDYEFLRDSYTGRGGYLNGKYLVSSQTKATKSLRTA
jgi:hypothetical protein